ncbi:MAG: PPC domain-containing protein [Gemmataceae bacterium]|nr:PPC domain-containing protein [Gemmataceae bacterium]MDW8264606.1 PPC domain-containing protein [Gemmataceae bacterium]
MRRCPLLERCCLAAALALTWSFGLGPGYSQKKPAPVAPNPQAPNLAMPFPCGMQRGSSLDLVLTGSNLAEPTGLWTGFPATCSFPTENTNDANRLTVRLQVPKDAPLGCYGLRLATTRGLSNLRLFCIDDLPQVVDNGTNHSKETAQAVPVPCVVVGRADAEQNDYFKVHVEAGQRLSFEVLGRRLGSIFDPQLTLFDARTGREVLPGHSNDAPGLQTDPRLTMTFKQAGDYLVEVRDVLFRGGVDYVYRLRIGDFPCATAPVPMVAKRGSSVLVSFAGPMVEGVEPQRVEAPADPAIDTLWLAPRGPNGLHGWPVALGLRNVDELIEQEPNNTPAQAQVVTPPVGITGRFLAQGDADCYAFEAKKGQRLRIEAQTLELYSPTEVYFVVRDARGAEVAKSNPSAAPPGYQRIDFDPPADGRYTVVVEHLHLWGGPTEVYHLSLTALGPDFDLTLPIDRYDVPQEGTVKIDVQAVRRGYTGPIELSVAGRGLAGQGTIAAGQTAGALIVRAEPGTALGPYAVRIRGQGVSDGRPISGYVNLQPVLVANLGGLPFPPRDLNNQVGIGVIEKPPFQLLARVDPTETVRGRPVQVTVTAQRREGFAEEITIAADNLPPGLTATVRPIPANQSEVRFELQTTVKAVLGPVPLTFTGKAKVRGQNVTVTSAPVSLTLVPPFELKVEPTPLKLAPGGQARLRVTATRRGGYDGRIDLDARNLPPGVTATKVVLKPEETTAEIELSAAPSADIVDKADVVLVGTAEDRQTVSTPNFTLSVAKP